MTQLEKACEAFDDLRVKAMLFDMDIDIETGQLIPKNYAHKRYLARMKNILNKCPDLPANHWLRSAADSDNEQYQPKPWLEAWKGKLDGQDYNPYFDNRY